LKKVYINATSIKSACGDTGQTFDAVFNKKSALVRHDNIVPQKTVCIGKFKEKNSFEDLLIQSVEEVLSESDLEDFSNTLLLVGSSVGGMATTEEVLFRDKKYDNIDIEKHTIDVIASTLDKKYNFLNTRSFSTACTSSANALKVAKELINYGAYENILVVGADAMCMTTVFGFSSLGILSDEMCTPFQNNRKGMNVAEGIATLLVQNKKLENSIELKGAGTSSDAHHIANPDPSAAGAMSAIKNALKDASLTPDKLSYVNAHGTGTQANDETEAKALEEIFGKGIAISSSKSNFGHTLGAAGAIEAAICVEILKRQTLAPQILTSDNEKDLNFVENATTAKIENVLSNSFAFGGNNTSLIFGVCHES